MSPRIFDPTESPSPRPTVIACRPAALEGLSMASPLLELRRRS